MRFHSNCSKSNAVTPAHRYRNSWSDIPKAFLKLKTSTVLSNRVSILGECLSAHGGINLSVSFARTSLESLAQRVSKGGQEWLHGLKESGWP